MKNIQTTESTVTKVLKKLKVTGYIKDLSRSGESKTEIEEDKALNVMLSMQVSTKIISRI